MQTKTCKKCGAIFKSKNCLVCNKAAVDKYKKNNKEKVAANRRRWQIENPEKVKLAQAKWYANNTAKAIAISVAWQKENPVRVKENRSRRCVSNIDKDREKAKEWRNKNPEKMKMYKLTAKKSPHLHRINEQNRRARKRANGGVLSKGLAEKLFTLQRGKCACCGKPLGDNYHLDHIMPVTLGGKHEDSNIQLLMANCNQNKYNKHPIDFMQSRGFLL